MSEKKRKKKRAAWAAFLVGTALAAVPTSAASDEKIVNDIGRYCTTCWYNARIQPDCWEDCTQQVLIRLIENLHPRERLAMVFSQETDEHRELVRAVDAVKKRTKRTRRLPSLPTEYADRRQTQSCEIAEKRAWISDAAARCLKSRQRRIIALSLDGCSVKEISRQLRIRPERVSDEKYKAVKRLQRLA